MGGLTKNQIQFIENYLVHHKIKYWDVQIELLDHIVCKVEEKMKEGISFETSMEQVHKSFGNKVSFYAWDIGANKSGKSIYEDSRGYKKLLIEKRKHITKKIRRSNWIITKEIIGNYKIMVPFLLISGLVLSLADNIGLTVIFLSTLFLMIFPCLYVWIDQFKKRKNKSLALVVYSGWVGLSLQFSNVIVIFKGIDKDIIRQDWFLYGYTFCSFIVILFGLISFIGYKKLEKEYTKQYNLLVE